MATPAPVTPVTIPAPSNLHQGIVMDGRARRPDEELKWTLRSKPIIGGSR